MTAVLTFGVVLFLIYAVFHTTDRPGLLAAAIVNSYVFSNYLGSVGVVMGGIALIISIGTLAKKGGAKIQKSEVGLLAWISLSVISVAASWQIDVGFFNIGSLFALCLTTYLFGRTFGNYPFFVRDLVLGVCIIFVLCEPGFIISARSVSRISGDVNAVGASSIVSVPILGCLALLFFNNRISKKEIIGIMAFLIFAVVPAAVALGTRSVFLGAGVVLLAFMLFRVRQKNVKRLIAGLAGAVAMMTASIGAVFITLSFMGMSPEMVFKSLRIGINFFHAGGGVVDQSSLLRLQFYKEAIDLILNSPLFGYSFGAFSYLANNANGGYPHNMFLEILVNSGIVGLIFFLFWIVPLMTGMLKKLFQPGTDWSAFFVFGLFVDSLVTMQVSFTIVQGKLLFLALGIMVAQLAGQKLSEHEHLELSRA